MISGSLKQMCCLPTKSLFNNSILLKSFLGLILFSTSAQALPSNDELKIGVSQEFENMNPLIGTMVATTYISNFINRSMVYMNDKGVWAPQLAKSIPTIENKGAKLITLPDGKKGLQVTWEILDNAKWGDGKPVTCEDFKFAWEVGSNPNVSVGARETYEVISKIDIDSKNPKKCIYTLNKPRFDYYQGVPGPLPKHLEESVLKQYGNQKEGYDQNSMYTKSPTNVGLYNGPYVVSEIKLGSHVTLTPNPNFYGKPANIKKVIFKLIPNTSTLEANLRSGTIDMISVLGLAFDQALAFEDKVKSESLPYKVLFQPSTTFEHIDLNLENEFLKDIKVRKALLHSINRDELTKALFRGRQEVAIHNISPLDPLFTKDPKDVVLYEYSKRKAAQLFDEAGWKLEKDGYRYKDGKKLSFVFMTTAGNKTRETVQTLLQTQWKAVGVEIAIKNEPARVFFGDTMKERKYGGMGMFAWISTPDTSSRSTLHSSNITTKANSYSGQNYTGWKNLKVDKALDDFDIEFNKEKRKKLTYEVLKAYTDEVPVIPLYFRSEIAVVPSNLQNYKISGHQFYDSNIAETWNLEGSKLK